MNDSTFIDRIAQWLQTNGVTVHLFAFDLPCAGLYRSESQEVFLNCPTARDALLTLAHEAGHWVGYKLRERPLSYQRERQAFVYGWRVLQLVQAPVPRHEWIHEKERQVAPDVDTSGFRKPHPGGSTPVRW